MKANGAGQRPGFIVRAILIALVLGAVSPAHAVAIGEEFRLAPEESRETFLPFIASDTDGSFFAAWSTPQGIYARRFSASAEPLSDAIRISAPAAGFCFPRMALAPDKGFVA